MIKSDLLIIAEINVGSEAKAYCMLSWGKWPGFAINKLLNQRAAIITIGTKDKNSTNFGGKVNFFNKTNGITLDNKVVIPQKMIVVKMYSEEDMLYYHS